MLLTDAPTSFQDMVLCTLVLVLANVYEYTNKHRFFLNTAVLLQFMILLENLMLAYQYI